MLSKVRVALFKGPKKSKQQPSVAWGSVERVVRLAARANIPFVGGALRAASEVLNVYHVMDDNKKTFAILLETVARYSDYLWEYIEAMTPEYLRESTDYRAQVARNAIVSFGRDIEKLKLMILKYSQGGFLKRGALSASIKEEIAQVEHDLLVSHSRFKAAAWNTVMSGIQTLNEAQRSRGTRATDLQIFGARSLLPDDVDGSSMVVIDNLPVPGLWTNVVQADVQGNRRIVKMYYESLGGEQAFLRDIRWYGRNMRPNLPGIYGYSKDSSIPFIVFGLASAIPLRQYLSIVAMNRGQEAIGDVLLLMARMTNALRFIASNNPDSYQAIQSSMQDAVVDDNGRVILAPDPGNESWFMQDESDVSFLMGYKWHPVFNDFDLYPFRALFGLHDWDAALQDAETRISTDAEETMQSLERFSIELVDRYRYPREYTEDQESTIRPGDIGVFDLKNDGSFRFFCNMLDDPALGHELEVSLITSHYHTGGKHDWYCDQTEDFKRHPSLSHYNVLSLVLESTPRTQVEEAGPGGETPYLSDATLVDEEEESENDQDGVPGDGEDAETGIEKDNDQDLGEGEGEDEDEAGMFDGDDEDEGMSAHTGDDEGSQRTNDSVLGYPCPGTVHLTVKAGNVRDFGIDYFREHARDIAKRHAVTPEDLALCIESAYEWSLEGRCPCLIRPLLSDDKPLYLHIRTDEYGTDPRAWYSFSRDLFAAGPSTELEQISQFGPIDISRTAFTDCCFVQMETWDLNHST